MAYRYDGNIAPFFCSQEDEGIRGGPGADCEEAKNVLRKLRGFLRAAKAWM